MAFKTKVYKALTSRPYTLFQNGHNFSILLFTRQLALVALLLRENNLLNFEFKNEAT